LEKRREQKGNRRKEKGKKKGIGGKKMKGKGIPIFVQILSNKIFLRGADGTVGAATLNNNSACRNTTKFIFMTSKNLEDRGSSFL
jgi:hypothetical protein